MNKEIINFSINDKKVPVTKLVLDEQEWLAFIANIKAELKPEELAAIGIDFILQNRCVPIFRKEHLSIPIDTDTASVLSGEVGEIYFRMWWAENGGGLMITKVVAELFNLPIADICKQFKKWWSKLDHGPNVVNDMAVRKTDNFDLSHVRIWLSTIKPETKSTKEELAADPDSIYLARLKVWMWSTELVLLWFNSKLIENGKAGYTFAA